MAAETFETAYDSAEHAFFHMVTCQKYASAGARHKAGMGLFQRPGGPNDVRIVIERLYRERKLSIDHINVLRWYGKREMRPDERREKEVRAAMLWDDAMAIIGVELLKKGMIDAQPEPYNTQPDQYREKLLSDANGTGNVHRGSSEGMWR